VTRRDSHAEIQRVDALIAAQAPTCDRRPSNDREAPSDDASVMLAEHPRGPRHDPGAEVVRWSLDTFTPDDGGRPARYFNVRVWFRGQDGAMHPTRRGTTLRLREAPEVLVAIFKALDDAGRARVRELLGGKQSDEKGGDRG
jgi:hypothetical protein